MKKLILLADDSPMIHRHTVPILEDAGYEVVSAMDGAEGLRSAREFKPDDLDPFGVPFRAPGLMVFRLAASSASCAWHAPNDMDSPVQST